MEKRKKGCFIIVDPQNDFGENGSLKVCDNVDSIYKIINEIIIKFKNSDIILTQDYHPPDHRSFSKNHIGTKDFESIVDIVMSDGSVQKQICWPVHCVVGTFGVKFNEKLLKNKKMRIVRKGLKKDVESYSAVGDSTIEKKFEKTGLVDYLNKNNYTDCFICGLAYDFCVGETACDLQNNGFNCHIIVDATRFINQKYENELYELFEKSQLDMTKKLISNDVKHIKSNEIEKTCIELDILINYELPQNKQIIPTLDELSNLSDNDY